MIEMPNFIGGPLCGKALSPGDELPDELDIEGVIGGTYQRLTLVPNWLVDIPFRPANPVYLWAPAYHDTTAKGPA